MTARDADASTADTALAAVDAAERAAVETAARAAADAVETALAADRAAWTWLGREPALLARVTELAERAARRYARECGDLSAETVSDAVAYLHATAVRDRWADVSPDDDTRGHAVAIAARSAADRARGAARTRARLTARVASGAAMADPTAATAATAADGPTLPATVAATVRRAERFTYGNLHAPISTRATFPTLGDGRYGPVRPWPALTVRDRADAVLRAVKDVDGSAVLSAVATVQRGGNVREPMAVREPAVTIALHGATVVLTGRVLAYRDVVTARADDVSRVIPVVRPARRPTASTADLAHALSMAGSPNAPSAENVFLRETSAAFLRGAIRGRLGDATAESVAAAYRPMRRRKNRKGGPRGEILRPRSVGWADAARPLDADRGTLRRAVRRALSTVRDGHTARAAWTRFAGRSLTWTADAAHVRPAVPLGRLSRPLGLPSTPRPDADRPRSAAERDAYAAAYAATYAATAYDPRRPWLGGPAAVWAARDAETAERAARPTAADAETVGSWTAADYWRSLTA